MAFRNHNTNTLNSVGGENSSWRAVGSTKSNIPKVLPVHSKENELPSLNGKQGAPNNVDHEFTSLHRMNQYGQPRAQNQQYQHGTLENSIKSPPRWSSDERICSVGAFGSLNRHSDHPPMFAVNRRDEPLKYADTKGEPFSVGSYRGWKTGASGGNINVPRTESIVSNSFIRQDPSSGELAIYSSQEVGYATTAIKNFSISESEKTTVGTNSVKQFGTDKIPSSRGYAVPPGFTSYSAAARSFLPAPPKTKVPTPAFEIYKEYRSESTQRPDIFHEDPQTLEQYSRELHALSERCDRDSAQQAEFLLRRIIYNYKNGIHAVQPDGGCYNR